MNAPILTDLYAEDEESKSGILIIIEGNDGEPMTTRLRKAEKIDLVEHIITGKRLYGEVDYEPDSPYSEYDFDEVVEPELALEVFGEPTPPRKFTEVVLVGTPRMALI